MPAKSTFVFGRSLIALFTAFLLIAICCFVANVLVAEQIPQGQSPTSSAATPDPIAAARALLQAGHDSEAESSLHGYIARHPDSADAHFLLGEVLFKDKRAKESLAEYTEGAKFRTPGPAELKIVSFDYVLLGDYADADKWLTRVVKEVPTDAEAWYFLGRARYNENRFDDAVSAFQQCLKLEPKSVKAEDNLGLAYQGLDRIDNAIAAFQTAISWQAEAPVRNPDPYINLGAVLIEQNRPAEAAKYLDQALAIPTASYLAQGMAELEPRAHEYLAKAYSRLNQLSKAETELVRALELAPDDAHLHYELAQIYQREGQSEKAKAEFNRYTGLGAERKPNH